MYRFYFEFCPLGYLRETSLSKYSMIKIEIPRREKRHTSFADSTRTWSYSLRATRNMIDVTFSKQWIHFLLSDRWPPTSTILMIKVVGNILFSTKQIITHGEIKQKQTNTEDFTKKIKGTRARGFSSTSKIWKTLAYNNVPKQLRGLHIAAHHQSILTTMKVGNRLCLWTILFLVCLFQDLHEES